jgi:hypothetical protein
MQIERMKLRGIVIIIAFLFLFGACAFLFREITVLSRQNNLLNAKFQSYRTSSDFWLKQYLMQKYPKLEDPSVDDWTKVNLLRQICADMTPWADSYPPSADVSKVEAYSSAPDFSIYTNSISNTLYRLRKEQKGFLCGGAAYNLKFLYQLFGYRSYVMNYGWPGNCTHVVTLVEIAHKGKRLIAVQDAFLNMTVVDKKRNPIDYRKLISELRIKNVGAIEIISNTTARLIFVSKVDNAFAIKLEQLGVARISESDKVISLVAPKDDPTFMSKAVDYRLRCLNFIEGKTEERHILMLFLYPLGTSGEAEAQNLMEETLAKNSGHS